MPQRSSSGRGSAAGRTGNRAREVNEAELSRLKVDELRERLRARGVTGTSALRKDELVKSLVKSLREEHKGNTARTSDKKTTPARGRTASAKSRAFAWSSASRSRWWSRAYRQAAARNPACRIAPPNSLRARRAWAISSFGPSRADPTGAPSPLLKQTETVSKCRHHSRAGTPEATTAFHSRAPSRCIASPCRRAQADTSRTVSIG